LGGEKEKKVKVYKKRRPLKIVLRVLGVLLAVVILLSVVIFFGFQKYIVYTPDGVRLEIPFLQKYGPEAAQTPEISLNP
jgi:hypothetical protein